MKPSSEKRLQQLHPALGVAVRAVIGDLGAQGIIVEVVQGLRTFEEQDVLYARGRTKPGQIVTQARGGESNHNYGSPSISAPSPTTSRTGMLQSLHGRRLASPPPRTVSSGAAPGRNSSKELIAT